MNKKDFPIIPSDRADDLHNLEIAGSSDLVLFMAGNQFMAMQEIISAFQQEYPEVKRIFYETLPPGLELKQILSGGALFRDKTLDIYPDIYTSVNENAMKILERSGHINNDDYCLYLHNRLTLMVQEGNPVNINSVIDMGRDDVRISQPDPENEDIAFHIMDMYRQAGGDSLVWNTEVIHARSCGLAFDVVKPGENLDQRDKINYYVCKLSNAPHQENAQKFIDLITSSAQQIYKKYGFLPHFKGKNHVISNCRQFGKNLPDR